MEELTKQQLFLAVLLTSFVTSIATGIVTVSLMEQAPTGMVQTINRVVEHTVEKVISPPTQTATVITKEVVVKENDLITAAIEKNEPTLVRISSVGTAEKDSSFAGLGVVVSLDGTIVADSNNFIPEVSYTGTFPDGTSFPLAVVFTEELSRVVIFKAVTDGKKYTFMPATLGNSDTLKLGETVEGLSGNAQVVASVGVISSFYERTDNASTTIKVRRTIDATTASKDMITGGPLIDRHGNVVGIKVGNNDISYVPINLVKEVLTNPPSSSATTTSTVGSQIKTN